MAPRLRVSTNAARRWTGLVALFFVSTGLSLLLWAVVPMLVLEWDPVAISSGSMEPGIRQGDVVVAQPFKRSLLNPETGYLNPGMVVVFPDQAREGRVTHRIVAVTPAGSYVTKGDANDRQDSSPVPPDQIQGIGRILVPMIGQPVVWLHDGRTINLAMFSLAALLAMGLAPRAFAPVPVRPGAPGPGWRSRVPAPVGVVLAWAGPARRLRFAAGLQAGVAAVFGLAWLQYGGTPPVAAYGVTFAASSWAGAEVLTGRRRVAPPAPAPEATATELAAAVRESRWRLTMATGVVAGLVIVFVGAWVYRGLAPHVGAFAVLAGAGVWWVRMLRARHRAAAAARGQSALLTVGLVVALMGSLHGFGLSDAMFISATDNVANRFVAAPSFSQIVLHLHDFPTPPVGDTRSRRRLFMDTTAPTATVLYNYDTNRDSEPGLVLRPSNRGLNNETRNRYNQIWLSRGPYTINGPVTFDFWSAMKDFDTNNRGIVLAGLYECRNNGRNCTQIARQRLRDNPWDTFGTGTWIEKTIDFGTVVYNVPANRSLVVKIVVANNSQDDMWFAYDTVQYDSKLTLP